MMKNLTLMLFAVLVMSFNAEAQIKTPSASPSASFTQAVGLSEIAVEYSRPSVKGRTIFAADGLVPFGKIWRTGANAATKVTFSTDVMIEGNALPAGSYAVLTQPDVSTWAVHFYAYEGRSWASYREKTPTLAVNVNPQSTKSHVESFLITVDDLRDESATLKMHWANTVVPISVGAPADEKVMANIDQVLAGPSKGDYYTAASYYFSSGKDLNKALEWVNIATEGDNPKFWQVKRKSEILAKLGKMKEAVKAAEMSLELAQKAGNDDYIKMNKDNIAKWSM